MAHLAAGRSSFGRGSWVTTRPASLECMSSNPAIRAARAPPQNCSCFRGGFGRYSPCHCLCIHRDGKVSPESLRCLPTTRRTLPFARELDGDRLISVSSFNLDAANRMDDGTLCVTYRATNSFNAVVLGRAVITKVGIISSHNRDRFIPVWNRRCASKGGTNGTHIHQTL